MKDFVLGHEISSHEQALAAMVDCQQVLFHQNARNHLILVFTREILMLDLDIGQTVSNPMDLNYRFPFIFTKKNGRNFHLPKSNSINFFLSILGWLSNFGSILFTYLRIDTNQGEFNF